MIIYLCYGYRPHTTAVYFERALRQEHEVYYVGPGYGPKPGYLSNVDLADLITQGLPQPDLVLFVEPGINFFPRGLEKLSCPTACYLIDVHQSLAPRERYAQFFDYIFVAQRDFVAHFNRIGYSQVSWLPLACDPDIHGNRKLPKVFDVGFVGHVNSGRRLKLLEQLTREFTVNNWQMYYPKEQIAEIYCQSRIVFNCSVNDDLNMRVFEGMASGSLLVTDRIANGQADLFDNEVHLVEYQTDGDLIVKVRELLADDARREAIATKGQIEVLAKHTYQHRCETILATIFSSTPPRLTARCRQMESNALRRAYAEVYSMLRVVDPILDELELAWSQRRNRFAMVVQVALAMIRRINGITHASLLARRLIKRLGTSAENKP